MRDFQLLWWVVTVGAAGTDWAAVKEWGGWLFGGISACVAFVVLVRRELDARIDERVKLVLVDPDGPVTHIMSALDDVRATLASIAERLGVNTEAHIAMNQRVSDVKAAADATRAELNARILVLEGQPERRSGGDRRGEDNPA